MKKIILLFTLICLAFIDVSAQCGANANFAQTVNGSVVTTVNLSTCNGCITTGYSWNFGDGNSSSSFSPIHTYASAGTYNLCLIVTAIDSFNNICQDTTCQTIIVLPTSNCMATLLWSSTGPVFGFNTVVTGSQGPFIYSIDFGDGSAIQTNSSGNFSHAYNASGTYYPCVTVTDLLNNSCTSCDTIVVNLGSCGLIASFGQSTSGLTTTFTNSTSCNSCTSISYVWDFGDGSNTSTLTNPVHSYTTAGIYGVTLYAIGIDSNNNTCVDSAFNNVVITTTQPCNTQLMHTTNMSTAYFSTLIAGGTAPIIYSYDFGDGSPVLNTPSQSPLHTYATAGTYVACVTATDINNISCTACDSVNIAASTSCITFISAFANGSTITSFANGSQGTGPYTYSYTLSPGNITNTSGVFNNVANGNYSVCATATDTNNIVCSTACDSVFVWVQQPCTANLTSSITGNQASLTASVTGSAASYTYYFDFGDGSPVVTSTNPNITHHYTNTGTFNACVTAVNGPTADSCASCTNVVITTSPCGLYIGFTKNSVGLTTTFTNTTNCNSCTSISYIWNFGDGNSSTLTNPTHTYATTGNYLVSLSAIAIDSSNNTCVDSVFMQNNVQPLPPCNIYMTTSTIQLTTTFTPVVTNVLPPLTYFFDYGDGTTGTSNVHTYPTTGTYYPCLTVTDANNITCTFCDTIIVTPPSCNTSLFTTVNGTTVTATANGSWGTAPYTYSYTLTPGNITNSTGIFTGLTNGTYTICATATDATNIVCSTICDSAFIWVQQPCYTSLFTTMNGNTLVASASATFGTAPYTYSYNLMPGNITNTSGFFNISSSGTYTVCATATDAQNQVCSTACDTLNIVVTPPQGNCFTYINSTVSGSNVVSVATSTGGVAPYWYQYTLMPGNITNNTGVFTNLAAGIYTICPLSVDSLGDTCVAFCDTVQIGGISPCYTTVNVTSVITPIGYTINATATATGGTPGYTYTYTLNPGNITNTTGTFIGLPSGLYVVCATAIDSLNNICSTDCDSVLVGTISSSCVVNAAFSESILGLSVNFTNNATITGGVISNYGWSFGDGNVSALASPSHTYLSGGTYTVVLAVNGFDTLQNPCVDSISKTITVGPNSVSNVQANKLLVYPNPTNSNFTIELPSNESMKNLVITDVSGRTIDTDYRKLSSKRLSISLKNQASGIYFIKLLTNKNFYTSSIMKQE